MFRLNRPFELPEHTGDDWIFRNMAFFQHSSCDGQFIYGDDGEMYCQKCDIDFMRDSAQQIWDRISEINLQNYAKSLEDKCSSVVSTNLKTGENMEKFAKLFESKEYGQILVINDKDSEDLPALVVKFTAEGLGVCEACLSYADDSNESYDKRDESFKNITEVQALGAVKGIIDQLKLNA